jgi:ABC-type transport system involved in cytochrome bd biosynthesis fused ATPase/permease subunit
VGAAGRPVSGGERQRLALARVLLADPAVLLLDEPTDGLDEATADALMTDLMAAARGRTTVVVTHRPVPMAGVDEILTLRDGRVAQRRAPAGVRP